MTYIFEFHGGFKGGEVLECDPDNLRNDDEAQLVRLMELGARPGFLVLIDSPEMKALRFQGKDWAIHGEIDPTQVYSISDVAVGDEITRVRIDYGDLGKLVPEGTKRYMFEFIGGDRDGRTASTYEHQSYTDAYFYCVATECGKVGKRFYVATQYSMNRLHDVGHEQAMQEGGTHHQKYEIIERAEEGTDIYCRCKFIGKD